MNIIERRPKTGRGRKNRKKREPKVVENAKQLLCLKGPTTSQLGVDVLKQLVLLKKPLAKLFGKREAVRPFEDISSVEYLCKHNDCSLFAYTATNKKRPHQLVIGRCFNYQMLDMYEFLIDRNTFLPYNNFNEACTGVKTGIIFQGSKWEDEKFSTLKNLFTDFFRGDQYEGLNITGFDRVYVITLLEDEKILFRHYKVTLGIGEKGKLAASLDESGPRIDLKLNRQDHAAIEVQKRARKMPRPLTGRKKKNISRDALGHKMGKIHMERQNIDSAALRKFKGTGAAKQKVKVKRRVKTRRRGRQPN